VDARPVTELLDRKMLEAGAARTVGEVFMSGANYRCHDAILQVGLPELEYPRTDAPPNFRIVGLLPPLRAAGRTDLDWWADIVSNSELQRGDPERRKVVVVAQGTVETEPTELIIRAMQLLEGRRDITTIAILGSRGARLPDWFEIPDNARVVDYLVYDAVLPLADLWIHNGGYGATTQGIAHGVPMVIAGEGQDKPESARRVAWSGLGLDLGCARPAREQLESAIHEVLTNPKFRDVAERMKKTAQGMDCFGLIESEINSIIEKTSS